MFKELSVEVRNYLGSLPEFTSVMKREVDGTEKLLLFPIVGSLDTPFPFATYLLSDKTPYTKDSDFIEITLFFWFDIESYDQCCEFTDVIGDLIEEKYLFKSSSVTYNEDYETYCGVVVFSVI